MQNDIPQIALFPTIEETKTTPKPLLPEVVLPQLTFNKKEQLMLAFQNRDERALEYLLSDAGEYGGLLGRKDRFIYEYLNYCRKLQQKYGQLFIQTHPGNCSGCRCINRREEGFSVTVHRAAFNKQVWVFNLLYETLADEKFDIWKCHEFKVDKTMV